MSRERKTRSIDPELHRRIASAKASNVPVSAVFTLRTPPGKAVLSPREAEATARDVVRRAEGEAAVHASDMSVFPHLQSFAVQAPAALLERLAEQPEIEAATANEQQDDLLIRPVTRKEVALEPAKQTPKEEAPRHESGAASKRPPPKR